MKARLVSHESFWPARFAGWDGLTIPAALPGLAALRAHGVPHVTTSSFLARADYQEVWQRSFQDVWALVERSMAGESRERPNLAVLHGYSLFLLLCESRVVWRALDRIHARHTLDEVVVESVAAQDQEDRLIYASVYSPYFHDVATWWGASRGVRVTSVAPAPGVPARAVPAAPPVNAIELRHVLARRLRQLVQKTGVDRGVRQSRIARPVYFVPHAACGLGQDVPAEAIDASGLLAQFAAAPDDASAAAFAIPRVDGLAVPGMDPPGEWLQDRLERSLRPRLAGGLAVFHGFRQLLRKSAGPLPALVSAAPFVDFGGFGGYMAEAFRLAGAPVASVQHGGNYRLIARGGVPTLFSDLIGGTFFQWGPGRTDESATYGARYPFTSVTTGTVRMHALQASSRARPAPLQTARLRVLYAPTTLDIATSMANNPVWDQYFGVIQEVLAAMGGSRHACRVKLMNAEEANFIDAARFPALRFLRRGSFVDYMRSADLVITDSLGGSPFYEALATDLPIVLYAATEHQEWDPAFIDMVRRRALCFWDAESYVRGIGAVLEDPAAAFAAAGVSASDELRRTYFPAATTRDLWAAIGRSFDPAGDACLKP